MQLSPDRSTHEARKLEAAKRRKQLAAATLSLLGISGAGPASAEPLKWTIDSGLLYYKEGGGRVQAIEPVVNGSVDLGNDRLLSAGVVLDTLSGATPNGATPWSQPQTFTSPSGKGKAYTIAPGETPLDPTFKDTRIAGNLGYRWPLTEVSKLQVGLNGSKEYDFLSAGANALYAYDLNERNTTLSAGLGFEFDRINPVGGAPDPLGLRVNAPIGEANDGEGRSGPSKSKNVKDLLVGVTQVIDARSLVQFNYSLSLSNGYETDPYKFLSVVDDSAEPLYYVYEKRPGSRTRHAFFAEYKRSLFGRDSVDLSYRYFTDNWGIRSHTANLAYRWNLSERSYLEPSARYYKQVQADFYRTALYSGEDATVGNASADPRLGAFSAVTGGLKYGHLIGNNQEVSVRLQAYKQFAKTTNLPAQAADALSAFDLSPNLSAVMLTIGYRFNW